MRVYTAFKQAFFPDGPKDAASIAFIRRLLATLWAPKTNSTPKPGDNALAVHELLLAAELYTDLEEYANATRALGLAGGQLELHVGDDRWRWQRAEHLGEL